MQTSWAGGWGFRVMRVEPLPAVKASCGKARVCWVQGRGLEEQKGGAAGRRASVG